MLGKALGGGMLPVSLFLARKDVMDVFTPGDHGSTFGGYPLAAAVGLEALKTLVDEDLVDRSRRIGAEMIEKLKAIHSDLIVEVRGRGLFAGIQFVEPVNAAVVCERLMQKGVLTKDTNKNTIRFAPPLIIEREHIHMAVIALTDTLTEWA